LQFEVQILTAFEYAWQVATHDLVYKGDSIDWRRLRVSAYLRTAAEQADSLIAAFEDMVGSVPVSPHPDTERRERIVSVCKQQFEDQLLPPSLRPASWVRFGENVLELVGKYAGRGQVDQELDALLTAVERRAAERDAPVSGTLFQLIVSEVAAAKGSDALRRFPIVASSELSDIYRIPNLPNTVSMESDLSSRA
jgi:hypothetical protein